MRRARHFGLALALLVASASAGAGVWDDMLSHRDDIAYLSLQHMTIVAVSAALAIAGLEARIGRAIQQHHKGLK